MTNGWETLSQMVKISTQKGKMIQQSLEDEYKFPQTAVDVGGNAECFCGQKINALQWEQLETKQQ